MRKFYFPSITAILFSSLTMMAQPALEWPARYNGLADNSDESKSLVVDNSGNVFVTGSAFNASGNLDMVTIKYSPTGQQLWLQSHNGSMNDNDESKEIVIDAAGDVYVVGYTKGLTSGADITTIKYSSAGVQQWIATYNGAFNNYDQGAGLVVDASGNVFVAGYETVSNYTYDFVTIKYDNMGNQVWVQNYNGPGDFNDEPKDVELDASGNVYVCGPSDTMFNSLPNADIVCLKYNTSGVLQWRRVYDDAAHSYQYASKLTVDRNNNVIVAGYGFITAQGYNIFLLKWNSSGVYQWMSSYNYAANTFESPFDIITDSLNNIIVTGQGITATSSNTNDYVTLKYNAAGTFQWAARYDGAPLQEDRASSIALDDSLNIYVTGFSKGAGSAMDIAIVKYNPAGNQQYVLRYNNTNINLDDLGNDIVVKNGIIYATGSSSNLSNNDFITLKYSYAAVGITELAAPTEILNAYPNPASNTTTILIGGDHSKDISYQIFDSNGSLVQQICSSSISEFNNLLTIDLSQLSQGVYFVKIADKEIYFGSSKIVVQ